MKDEKEKQGQPDSEEPIVPGRADSGGGNGEEDPPKETGDGDPSGPGE